MVLFDCSDLSEIRDLGLGRWRGWGRGEGGGGRPWNKEDNMERTWIQTVTLS
jgi:hypothetical protein